MLGGVGLQAAACIRLRWSEMLTQPPWQASRGKNGVAQLLLLGQADLELVDIFAMGLCGCSCCWQSVIDLADTGCGRA